MTKLYQRFICKVVKAFDEEPKEYHKWCGGDWKEIIDLSKLRR